jgi:hypothetical protein
MAETNRRDLVKPGDPHMLKCAAVIRRQLLQFRFAHYKSIRPAEPQGAEALRPRSRDLLGSLGAALPQKGNDIQLLIALLNERHDLRPEIRFQPSAVRCSRLSSKRSTLLLEERSVLEGIVD